MKALIFDFDGLIVDTETPRYLAWKEIYIKHNCSLNVPEFAAILGSADGNFDFYEDLERKFGKKIDWETITPIRIKRRNSLLDQEGILPGVTEYLLRGKELGLKIALASSSPRSWIEKNLAMMRLADHFDLVTTVEDAGKAKPDPALFKVTLQKLAIMPDEAIVFEDSPNGCKAAAEAGIFCVAVPNQITACLPFDSADLFIKSMADVCLDDIIKVANKIIMSELQSSSALRKPPPAPSNSYPLR